MLDYNKFFFYITGKVKIGKKLWLDKVLGSFPNKNWRFMYFAAGAILYGSVPKGKKAFCNPAKLF